MQYEIAIMILDIQNSMQDDGHGCEPELRSSGCPYYRERSMNLIEQVLAKFIALLKITIIAPIAISTSARLKM